MLILVYNEFFQRVIQFYSKALLASAFGGFPKGSGIACKLDAATAPKLNVVVV